MKPLARQARSTIVWHSVPGPALSAALFAGPNPCVIKAVLHAQRRIPSPAVRLPLLPAAENSVRAVLSLLERER